MKKLKAIRTVYAYYFPEVRQIVDEITRKYPHSVYLKSIKPGLDNFHFPVIEKYIKFYKEYIPGLAEFNNRYVTNGSSEGILHLLVDLKLHSQEPIYVLDGDYEGYEGYGNNLGLKIQKVKLEEAVQIPKGIFIISNPSARNGNIIPNEVINQIAVTGHKIILDLTYLGMTKYYCFDVEHPNIMAIVVSLSKPFGLFYYRSGFVFSRQPMPTLQPNIWFKNILSLLIIDRLLTKLRPDTLYKKYQPVQKHIIGQIKKDTGIKILPSDVFILGNIRPEEMKQLSVKRKEQMIVFKRGDFYRLCLTPYFLEKEKISL